jgi:anti-sigma factor RsiW
MEHEQALEKLDEWIDGELAADESAALSRHLDACADCRREAALRKRLGEALFAPLPPEDPRKTEAFVRRVMGRVEAESVPAWRRLLGRALTPALGLGLAALLLSILNPGPGSASGFDGWDQPETPVFAGVP